MGKNLTSITSNFFARSWFHLLLILAIALIIFNFIGLILPFLLYPKIIKELIFAGSLLALVFIYRLILRKISKQSRINLLHYADELKRHWAWHIILAAAFTFLVASLTRFYPSAVPANMEINSQDNGNLSLPILFQAWTFFYPAARVLLFFFFFLFSSIYIRLRAVNLHDLPLQYGLLLILSYFFYTSLNYQNELINSMSHNLTILGISTLVFVLVPVAIITLLNKFPRTQIWMLLLIIVVATVLQIIFIRTVPNTQVSDFRDFNDLALKIAGGESGVSINLYATFIRLLSLFYRIFPSIDTAKAINIFLTALSMLGLFWIGKESGYNQVGTIAAYLFGMLPSQSGMVAIVNSDIPATAFLIFSVAFLLSYLRNTKWYKLVISAFFLGIALQIRLSMLTYAPILILPLFLQIKRSWIKLAKYAIALALGILVSILTINATIASARVEDMVINERRNIVSTLLKGTNMASEGRVNFQDGDLVQSWQSQEIWQKGLPIVIDRVLSDPIAYYQFLKIKYNYLFGDATYVAGYVFNFEARDLAVIESSWLFPVEKIYLWFAQFSQFSLWCVSGTALLFIYRYKPAFKNISWISSVLFLCAFSSYALFEVQPRYNRPLIPFLVLYAASFFALRKTDL